MSNCLRRLWNICRYFPHFPKDELTDKPERFFAAEMIREKVFMNYKKEVPYSTEVIIGRIEGKERYYRDYL